MRCINRRRRRRRNYKILILPVILIVLGLFAAILCSKKAFLLKYEKEHYQGNLYLYNLPVDKLCVSTNDVRHSGFETEDKFHAISLLDIQEGKVIYAEDIHEKLYPASTTKIMTAYLALKHGNLEDEIIVSANAQDIPIDSSRAGLRIGDKLLLKDLLYALMLPSGNDAAVAIAEHIAGSVDEFVTLMNEEAFRLGATNTHFVNPHGYQDDNHYTTAYDLYLMFNACMVIPEFQTIISSPYYELQITQQNGTYRNERWTQSNWYINGNASDPEGMNSIGGKTGTTDEAGSCLITLFEDEQKKPYLAIIMGAESRTVIYDNMNQLILSTLQ